MKGSEYLAARVAITTAGVVLGGLIITVAALWLVPLIMQGLKILTPNLLPPLGGVVVGLAVVVVIAVAMRHALDYCLVKFERWVVEQGGIED